MPALLALASAATFGFADFLGGMATRKASVVAATLVTNFAGGILAIVLAILIDGRWSAGAVGWGAFGGAFGLIGLVLLYQGLADGPNRLVSPVSAVVAAIVPIVVGVATGDRPGGLALLGLAIAPVAIFLVAGGDLKFGESAKRPLLLGLGAGIGFGAFFVFLDFTPADAGAVPLVAARVASLGILIVAALVRRPDIPSPPAVGVAAVAGTLDMTANGFFLWSTLEGDLAIVGALVSLFPAPTVLLAVLFLGERLDRKQATGLLLAIATAALLS